MDEPKSAKRDDVIEIPVGKYINKIRANPWQLSTFVLVLIVLVFAGVMLFGGGTTGNVISEDVAVERLLSFINAQGNGEATLVSTENTGSLYLVTVNYQQQNIPVFITLDGSYLITDPIPLAGDRVPQPSGTGNTEPKGPVAVELGDSPAKGNADAKVTFVEFSDYECPFCKRHFDETLPQLVKNYVDTGKVKIVFRDFPLSFHDPMATKEAVAANCAGKQGGDTAYFKYHDEIFTRTKANGNGLSEADLTTIATDLGLNLNSFNTCLADPAQTDEVKKDIADGTVAGASGTPTFVIGKTTSNGEIDGDLVVGAQPYAAFQAIIDPLLQ